MGNIARINKQLKEKYGCVIDGRPRWRVVWTSEQTEKMIAEFSDWYGHILIRAVHECREVLKYPAPNDRDRWVLETLIFQPWHELPESNNGHYEPLWIFREPKTDKFQNPTWRAVDFLVYSVMYGPKRSISDRIEEDRKAFAEEVQFFKDFFDNKAPYIATMLKEGHAITVPSNYEKGT